MNGTMKTAVA